MVETYKLFLEASSDDISGEVFNIGYQNYSVNEIAKIIQKSLKKIDNRHNIIIETVPTDDNRSYQINSDKIYKILGYKPKRSLEDAVSDLCDAFKKGKLPNSLSDDKYMNVKVMKNKNVS